MIYSMGGRIPEGARARFVQSIQEFQTYFREMIEARRRAPQDDLISTLVQAQEDGQMLSVDEVISLVVLLLSAGSETTTNLIGNAVLALLEHPEELAKVRANPALIPNLVEETVRYDTPVQSLPRQTTCDVPLGGTTIPAGAMVMPLFGSANRDEQKFADPDRFDVTRDTEGHLGFGYGIHFCLGAPLARLEGRIALEMVLSRFPRLSRVQDQEVRNDLVFLRGLKTFPLTVATA
jgi:cytochrome P450